MKSSHTFRRRDFCGLLAAQVAGSLLLGGCSQLGLDSPESKTIRSQKPVTESDPSEAQTKLVGDVAMPFGLNYVRVEGPALVTGLNNTGVDPAPSTERQLLIADMQARGVPTPSKVLASPKVSLVWVTGYLPPAVQKGDSFDVEVRVPQSCETSDLRNGWLMETRLKEMAVLGGHVLDGHLLGMAQGAVLIDPSANERDNKAGLVQGRVLGGGRALKDRPMGLALRPDEKSVRVSSQVGNVLNARFHLYDHGTKKGVATPFNDERVELILHPRYKDNIPRYLRVVRSIALSETPAQRLARLDLLERQLQDPVTSANAALRLEAIGKDGIRVLHQGLDAKDPEVRFYASEALAYLDDPACAKQLGQAAKDEPAFRAYALTALSTLNDVAANDQLRELLDVPSAETRYGAFRALRATNDQDASIRGEVLGKQFHYHLIHTAGPAMVHVTRTGRPEIVLFNPDQNLIGPAVMDAGAAIMVKIEAGGEATVSKFAPNQPDQKRTISTKLDDVIRTVVELGGTYPDVVQMLQEAKKCGSLAGRFEVDALPSRDRPYDRRSDDDSDERAAKHQLEVANPVPGLFSGDRAAKDDASKKTAKKL